MVSPTAYGLGIVFTATLGIISFLISNGKIPTTNLLYGTTSTLLLTYSIGASLLMYAMMLYLFTAFPVYQSLFVTLFTILLLLISFVTIFFNPWKVKARKDGASGVTIQDPYFVAFTTSGVLVTAVFLFLLLTFRNSETRKMILLLTNLLIVPSFFLTSGYINSFALNDFTYNF